VVAKKEKGGSRAARSMIQYLPQTIRVSVQKQKEIVRSLGLTKLNQVVERH